MSPLATLRQEDFRVGEQQDVAPHLINPEAVFAILNGLLDDDGSIYKRGGSVALSNTPFGSSLRGVWEGVLEPGRRTLIASTGAFAAIDADEKTPRNLGGAGFLQLPKPMAALEGMLFIGGGTIYGGSRKTADYEAGTIEVTKGSSTVVGTGTKWLANVDAGMLLRLPGENRVYVVDAIASDTQLSIRDSYEGETGAGHVYTLKRLETASAPYKSSDLYCTAAERLIVIDGNVMRFSEPKKPFLFKATIEPLKTVVDNEHEVGEGANILGVQSLGIDKVLVFTTIGMTIVSNLSATIVDSLGNTQHRIEKLAGPVLWGNGTGIAGYSGALVVPTMEDIYQMDGVSAPTALGQSIMPIYRRHIANGFTPGGAFVYRNHYCLPILDSGGVPQDLLVCRLDRPIFLGRHIPYRWPWSSMGGAGAKFCAGTVRVSGSDGAGDTPRALTANFDGLLTDIREWWAPTEAVKNDHDGTTALFSVTTRDYPAGQLSIGRFRRMRLLYEMIEAEGGLDGAGITCEVGTGIRREDGAKWDEVDWDEFFWAASDEETQFELLDGVAPPNGGSRSALAQNAWVWYLKTHARYARFRFQASAPVAKLTLRSLEIFIAETGGVRHAKVVDA